MIKSLDLCNFKCFLKPPSIEFAPLTILCGVNSSGKSSIIKSILTLKQSVEDKNQGSVLLLNGQYVDNGTFDDIVNFNAKEKDSFSIGNTFEINNYYYLLNNKKINVKWHEPRRDFGIFKDLLDLYKFKEKKISKFRISLNYVITRKYKNIDSTVKNINPVPSSSDQDDYLFLPYLNNNAISGFKLEILVFDTNNKEKRKTTIEYKGADSYTLKWTGFPTRKTKLINNYEGIPCILAFNGLNIIKIIQSDKTWCDIDPIETDLISLVRLVTSQYKGIHFVGPLRNTPERTAHLMGNADSVGLKGENTGEILAQIRNKHIVNNYPYLKRSESEITYKTLLNYWLNKFGAGKLSITGNRGVISIEINNHNISDVGFGVSQFLPILVQALYMNREETLLLEQPEIHLHPKMQLDMADFLIETAKTERNIIVETHSDHIVNRIVHRVMENHKELSSLVRIYYVNKTENGNGKIIPINIDPYIGTRITDDCPDFFVQYESETRDIVKTAMSNLIRDKK